MKKAIIRKFKSSKGLLARIRKLLIRFPDSGFILAIVALTLTGCISQAHLQNDNSHLTWVALPAQMLDQSHLQVEENYGKTNLCMEADANLVTIYCIRPLTKQYTASIITHPVEPGKVRLDYPFAKYLPSFPLQWHNMTVLHLLSYTSAIKEREIKDQVEQHHFRPDLTFIEYFDWCNEQLFVFSSEEEFDYNILIYTLLRKIISKVPEMLYEDYVEVAQLQPLEMSHMQYGDPIRVIPKSGGGY
jgi:CubicO group peptidase (beta-lactamase class C family)